MKEEEGDIGRGERERDKEQAAAKNASKCVNPYCLRAADDTMETAPPYPQPLYVPTAVTELFARNSPNVKVNTVIKIYPHVKRPKQHSYPLCKFPSSLLSLPPNVIASSFLSIPPADHALTCEELLICA